MKKSILSLIIIIACAITVIFYEYNKIPIHIAPDEIAFTRLALYLDTAPFTLYSPLETGHTTPYFYIILLFFKLFGESLFALRFPSAILGVLNSILVYFLFRIIFDEKRLKLALPYLDRSINIELALVLSLTFTFMRWHFNFARFSFEATYLLFLELVSLLSMLYFVKRGSAISFVISAVCTVLAVFSYTPGRIFFLIPLLIVILKKNFQAKEFSRFRAIQYPTLIFLIVLFFALGLLGRQIGMAGGDARVADELIATNTTTSAMTKVMQFADNTVKTALMFGLIGDMNGRHNYPGKPALNPIIFIFFISGFLYSIRRFNTFDKVFLIYFVISLLPTLLTHPSGNPNMLRTFTAIVPVVYFVGLSLTEVYNQLSFWLDRNHFKKLSIYLMNFFALLLIISALYELRTYFVFQKAVTEHSFEVKKSFEWVRERNFELVGLWYKE